MTKVVLIDPPTSAPTQEPLLSLGYLSATLKQTGHEVLILEGNGPPKRSRSFLLSAIKDFMPTFIGITLTIDNIPATYAWIDWLKKETKIPIVAGGPHATACPHEVQQHVDFVAVGEGESYLKKILKADKTIILENAVREGPLIENLDTIPFPDRSKIHHTESIFSSRGCPYNCTYCSSHAVFGRKYRTRSSKNVSDEIYELAAAGTRHIKFEDDEAFVNPKRTDELLEELSKYKGLTFSARIRIDNITLPKLLKMKAAGFVRLAVGVESYVDYTLKEINKGYTSSDIITAKEDLNASGISYHFNLMMGFPWEQPYNMYHFPIQGFTSVVTPIPYPGTALYNEYHAQYGFTDWWLDPKMNHLEPTPKAFFRLFASNMWALYKPERFWNHSNAMKTQIEWICESLLIQNLNQTFSNKLSLFLSNLTMASLRIWRNSPPRERLLFWGFGLLIRILGLHKRASFGSKVPK